MKRQVLLTNVAGCLILAAATMSSAMAQTAGGSPSAADTWWTYHGDVEVGGRFFANNPSKNGIASQSQSSLGKYYEYSSIKPGPFLNGWLNAGTKDGLYRVDVWGDNVGYSDQHIEVGGSKAGEYYFTGSWDQTPHIYSTNAQTLYNGLGTNSLTLPAGLAATLHGNCTDAAACASPALAKQNITNNLQTTDLGIKRDTAAVEARWTPTTNWDIQVAYSNMHRTGSQVDGIAFGPNTSVATAQVPKPVNDTTQNYAATGEYAGNSPWGQKFNLKVGYAGSTYTDKWNSYTVEDPFCPTSVIGVCGPGSPGGTTTGSNNYAPSALVSLWPSNQSNGINTTLGADLPAKSRYMGTVSYTMMRQNDTFLAFTNNTAPMLGTNANPTLPASSLNGAINTFLSNNVVTTQITPELKTKLSYRYYDFDNNTPELLFNDYILTDTTSANNRTTAYAPVSSLSISYNKQNAGADVVWSPTRQWNLGAGYGYERYKWTRADADQTHENSGKAFADYKPVSWITTRASWIVSDRHYDTYNYKGFVGNSQWTDPTCQPTGGCSTQYSTAMRQFYLDNRQRNVGKFSVSVDVVRGLTLTPTFGYQEDNYSISTTEAGLSRLQSLKSGIEMAYSFNPVTTFLLSYMNEQNRQNLKYTTAQAGAAMTSANTWHADVRDTIHTFVGTVNWGAIPEKLDLSLTYTLALSQDGQLFNADNGTQPTVATGGQFPTVKTQWTRLEALAKYTFDKNSVRMMGFDGQAYVKLRYVWERNSVDNLDQDLMAPYLMTLGTSTSLQRMTWMAYDNPNYNVHLVGASFGLKW